VAPVRETRAEKLARELEAERLHKLSVKDKKRFERSREQAKREALRSARRAARREELQTRSEAQLEINQVREIQKALMNRFTRAKLMARSVAQRLPGALKSYMDDNKANPGDIGWLENLSGVIGQVDTDFHHQKRRRPSSVATAFVDDTRQTEMQLVEAAPRRTVDVDAEDIEDLDLTPAAGEEDESAADLAGENNGVDDAERSSDVASKKRSVRRYGIDVKLVKQVDKAIVHGASKAVDTTKFGSASDVAAFFDGHQAAAIGFTLGKTQVVAPGENQADERLGISMGANFTYSTGHDSEDNAVSSEYIRQRFFRKLNLVKFKADPKLVLSAGELRVIKSMNGSEHGTVEWTIPIELWGEANKNGRVGDASNGCAGGIYFGVYKFKPNTNSGTVVSYMVIGFWGIVGMKIEELKVATYDAFVITASNINDLSTSCLNNLLRTGDPMIEHRELSLRAPQNDPNIESQLIKNSLGYFIVAENIDRRTEFPDFEVTGTLPKSLKDEVDSSELMRKYAGRTVFVDFNQKMIHYYTKEDGKLRVRTFNDAAELNNYDFVDLHSRGVALERKHIRDAISRYEASANEYGISLEPLRVDWARGLLRDEGMAQIAASNNATPDLIEITVEMLRASYNGSRILYNMVDTYFKLFSVIDGQASSLARGYTFIGEDDNEDLKSLATRMFIPQLRVMLMAAQQSVVDFPPYEEAKEKIEKQLEALENPDLDLKFPGLGRYLNSRGVAEFFKLKPHQVRALGMAGQLDKGVLDVDMGGGKTLISILLIIRRIEMLREQGVKPRALIVMPDALITNFYREIKKFTARDPNNKAGTARLNVVTLRNKNVRMKQLKSPNEIMESIKDAPDNTLILTAYSYLGDSNSAVKIFTGETRQGQNGKVHHKVEYMFPVVEDMLSKAGVNIVFLDESHKIKNNYETGSYAHKACMALSRVKYKFIMTGTFISRSPQDMFNQVKFIDPTMLGSVADFKRRYTLNNGRDWNHDKLKELRQYIQRRGVITMRREEWLYQMPRKEEKFFFANFEQEAPVVYNIYKTLWDSTEEQFPAEFTEALGGHINNETDNDNGLEDVDETDTIEDEDREIARLQSESNDLATNMRASTVAGRLMALRALVSAPERFPVFTEALRTVRERMSFNVEDLLRGPKDNMVLERVRLHFASTGGTYVVPAEQAGPESEKIGKIVIMSDRALIAQHMVRILKENGFTDRDVAYYDAAHREHLDAFCDPNNKSPFILCAVENSIKEGVNMQSVSRVIRLTIPWTTGDFDQSIARAFRTGQTKNVYVDNILCTKSFEPAMLARLITRENVNKKVSSDFDSNKWIEEITVNPQTAGPSGEISGEYNLVNYTYSSGQRSVNLLDLHQSIYEYELKMSNVWRASYLLKLCDTKEQMDRDPLKFVWKQLDRRNEIREPSRETTFHGLPTFIPREPNTSIENKVVYVIAAKKQGYMYIRDEKRAGELKPVRLTFYGLDNDNIRHEDRDIAGSSKVYEPWPTAGIQPEEMSIPQTNRVSEEEIEQRAERDLRDIGQDDEETIMRQRIVKLLRAASKQGLDQKLTTFLEKRPLSVDNSLVTTIYEAVMIGKFHQIFKKSKAVLAVYSAISDNRVNPNDDDRRLMMSFKRASKQFTTTQDAALQRRTGEERVRKPAPEPGDNERTISGPVQRDAKLTDDPATLQVAIGDQNGLITLVVPATKSNPLWKKIKGIPGYRVMFNSMFFPITTEAQLPILLKRLQRSGATLTNIDEFDTPEFKQVMRILRRIEKPDQTATVSVYNAITAARAVEIDLGYIVVDQRLLIIQTDCTAKQAQVLSACGFRRMQPYYWKEVTQKGIGREVKRLSLRAPLRNPVMISSRVYRLLKVKLSDDALGIAN
jgi:SNF2 family DNA or RNA helicase